MNALLLIPPAASKNGIVPIGHGVEPPKLIHKIDPHYTRTALDAGVQGNVL